MHRAVALILAGGFSSRMRGFKPLLPLPIPLQGPYSALEGLARTYRAAGVSHIMVVSGHRADEVEAEAGRLGLHSVRNAHPEQGMFSSVRLGLQALPKHYAFFFVHPVDIPLVRPLTLRLLWQSRHAQRPCLPTFRQREGHPLLLPATLWEAALAWQGEHGLQGWLHALSSPSSISPLTLPPPQSGLVHVPVPDRLSLCDMDTDAAYACLCRVARRQHLLEPAECRELLHLNGVSPRGLAHGRSVGLVAAALAVRLRAVQAPHCASLLGLAQPDTALCLSGGLLHDMCKGQPQHEQAAGELLRGLHLPLMAALVEEHKDMSLADSAPVSEKTLVYLADKYVQCHRAVTLEQRFGEKMRLFAQQPFSRQAVERRWRHAAALEARLQGMLGEPPATVAQRALQRGGGA